MWLVCYLAMTNSTQLTPSKRAEYTSRCRGQGVEKGEHPRVGAVGFAVQYTYPQRHEGFGKVDDLLSHVRDGQGSHCKISFLPTNNTQGKER